MQKLHICNNAEAPVSAELTFKLVSKICCPVIKELYSFAVGERIFQIDISADKGVQFFYFGHSFDMESVKFAYDKITDASPKYVLSLDKIDMSQNGIIHMNILDFLLHKKDLILT